MTGAATDSAEVPRTRRAIDVVSTALLALVSILVGFSAFQASLYADRASELATVSSSLLVESLTDVQSNNSDYVIDSVLWALSRAEAVAATPEAQARAEALRSAVSENWVQMVDRWRQQNDIPAADELTAPQLDQVYLDTFEAQTNATLLAMDQVNADARDASRTAARLTGASVVYSASLVMLTLAGSIRSSRSRIALLGIAIIVAAGAVIAGAAPVILPAV